MIQLQSKIHVTNSSAKLNKQQIYCTMLDFVEKISNIFIYNN